MEVLEVQVVCALRADLSSPIHDGEFPNLKKFLDETINRITTSIVPRYFSLHSLDPS